MIDMKKLVQNILDIPRIQEEVRSKHKRFVKAYGKEIEKVFADHKLGVDLIVAKIHRIAIVLKEEGVIDKIVINNEEPFASIKMWKEGMISYLKVLTNGKQILLKGYSYALFYGSDIESPSHRFVNVDQDDFDWVRFSCDLVDYIYAVLYERKEVIDTKMSSMFEPKRM